MYEIMFYGGTICAVFFFVMSLILFVKNNVWKLIGDVTGWNARKAMRRLDKKGAENLSKTEAIKTEVSKVLVRKATTTGMLQELPEEGEQEETGKRVGKRRKFRKKTEEHTQLLQQEAETTSSVFEVEEDMVVLAGGLNDRQSAEQEEYTTLLQQDTENEEEVTTKLYGDDEPTEILQDDLQDEVTQPLTSGDEETALLVRDGDEETVLLVREDDEETSVLNEPVKKSGIEAEITQFEPVLQEDEELMALLQEATMRNDNR